jgi:hypothetical protein
MSESGSYFSKSDSVDFTFADNKSQQENEKVQVITGTLDKVLL